MLDIVEHQVLVGVYVGAVNDHLLFKLKPMYMYGLYPPVAHVDVESE
jgi:hypothetical protein